MEIVPSNSERDLAHKQAVADVQWTLRELVANILRITRGAGKPYDLETHAADFLMASQRLAETDRFYSAEHIYTEALSWRKERD